MCRELIKLGFRVGKTSCSKELLELGDGSSAAGLRQGR
jgi:hypothetical protein